MSRPLTAIPESAAQYPSDVAHIRRFNFALSVAESRVGSALAWEASGKDWGTLRTIRGALVAYGANAFDALKGVSL